VVRWNGADRVTTFGSSKLTATIPASDIAFAGTAQVTIFTSGPATCNCTSNSQTFTINNLPVLNNVSPANTLAGGGGYADGERFELCQRVGGAVERE
jgi:hypothetical protein